EYPNADGKFTLKTKLSQLYKSRPLEAAERLIARPIVLLHGIGLVTCSSPPTAVEPSVAKLLYQKRNVKQVHLIRQ
ncbi:MAG: hypothetical protein L0Y77_13730, partial [Chlorobi bacterium]|nr:hypothetical protein [Chlorobiota bacterium]